MSESAERWCLDLIRASTIDGKLDPRPRPDRIDGASAPPEESIRAIEPGRPPWMLLGEKAERIPRAGALRTVEARARLLHLFTHHEIQAAELFAWAFLLFRDAPSEFRRGLLRLVDDELRHARLYRERTRAHGADYGSFPVRDWFWAKARRCADPRMFVALMGLGFEGANIEHAERFSAQLEAAGDLESARVVEGIGREEVAHVRFAARWFTHFDGGDPDDGPDYDRWAAALPEPLTPSVMRGSPLQRERRRRAGLSDAFLDALTAAGSTTSAPSPRSALARRDP